MIKGIDHRMVLDNWVVRRQVPEESGTYPVFLLLHGWTGDEDAMWVFTPRLPKQAFLLAPRGLYKAGPGGYAWHPDVTRRWPGLDDFMPAVERLFELLNPAIFPQGDFDELHLVGFSQGAATAYAFTLLHPEMVSSIAGLAGFMPEGVEALARGKRLRGLPVFVTHGTKDGMVPLERGRDAAQILEKAGAVVTYCEDDVGHKLSVKCFKGLENFYLDTARGRYRNENP